MDSQEVRWELYPRVAAQSEARTFIDRLVLKGKRPKTVDAYARSVEDLLGYFAETDSPRIVEADEADLDRYKEDARAKAMILLAYDAALRREELMSLRIADIDWGQEIVTIRAETTKGGRERHVPVSPAIAHLVRSYIDGDRRALIAAYNLQDPALIFLSESTRNPGRPLSVGAFDEIVERVRAKLGLHALTPHTLRHQRCTILKRTGVSLEDIALIAGHKSTETTLLYIHLSPGALSQRIRAKVESFDAPIRQLVEQAMKREVSREE